VEVGIGLLGNLVEASEINRVKESPLFPNKEDRFSMGE